jgi:CMP-2-keto-3-deoxyoctulosonic acid synthetase
MLQTSSGLRVEVIDVRGEAILGKMIDRYVRMGRLAMPTLTTLEREERQRGLWIGIEITASLVYRQAVSGVEVPESDLAEILAEACQDVLADWMG